MRTVSSLLSTAVLGTAVLLGACASVPMAEPGADAEGKRFEPPPPGEATLYLYRSSFLGSETVFELFDNAQRIGALADRTWVRLDVAPGMHTVACGSPSGGLPPGNPIDVRPGDMRFLEIEVSPGPPFNPRCSATEVSEAKGRAGVTGGARAVASR